MSRPFTGSFLPCFLHSCGLYLLTSSYRLAVTPAHDGWSWQRPLCPPEAEVPVGKADITVSRVRGWLVVGRSRGQQRGKGTLFTWGDREGGVSELQAESCWEPGVQSGRGG